MKRIHNLGFTYHVDTNADKKLKLKRFGPKVFGRSSEITAYKVWWGPFFIQFTYTKSIPS